MGAPGDLTTLTTALPWLGLDQDDSDGTIARLISVASSQVQKFIGYQLLSATYTRKFNGVGSRKLIVPDRPVTAVSSLTIDTVSVPASTSPIVDGYSFDDKFIYTFGWYTFTRGAQNIVATYVAGLATVPADIEQATLDWIKTIRETSPGISKIKAGDSEVTYDTSVTTFGKSTILIPPSVAAVLQPYRRIT